MSRSQMVTKDDMRTLVLVVSVSTIASTAGVWGVLLLLRLFD